MLLHTSMVFSSFKQSCRVSRDISDVKTFTRFRIRRNGKRTEGAHTLFYEISVAIRSNTYSQTTLIPFSRRRKWSGKFLSEVPWATRLKPGTSPTNRRFDDIQVLS